MTELLSSASRSLGRDQRGAIMIIGVGMGIFLVAMLYYLIGIGEAVLYREHLQDASDAAALSSALMHARGMNYIVFLNLVMEALVAVLLILNVIMTLLKIAIVALTAAAPFTFGSTAGLAAALAQVHQTVHSVYQPTESTVMTALTTLHSVSDAVSKAVPVVATLGTLIEVNAHLQRPVQFAFVVPTRLSLPVEPDRYSVLCERAAGDVADFAMQYMPEKARSLVHGAATRIAGAASGWLCGASDGPPPEYEDERRYWHPSPEGYESCQQSPEAALTDAAEAERCEQLRDEQQRNAPDEHGDCPADQDCTIDGPYEKMLAQARTQCKPDPSKALVDFRWQQKTISANYEWTGTTWILADQDAEPGRIMPSADEGAPL
ncbi:MAG TPA: hypothetical protein VL137_05045, partial [Polyangiaceae bacterium]|nr:hypothetical protein [Polyangiaceae bacterium]